MEKLSSPLNIIDRLRQEGVDYRTDIPAVRACAVAAFGGAKGLAEMLAQEYEAARPGSAVRAKILTTILDMIKDDPGEEEEFDDEDYEAVDRLISGGSPGGANGDST